MGGQEGRRPPRPPAVWGEKRGSCLRHRTRPSGMVPGARGVLSSGAGGSERVGYDALVVASGADPVRPPVPGLDHPRVFTIRSLDEAIELRRLLDTGTVRRATVVGAGYIGLETAEALVCAGIEVEVIEALPRVLGNVDEPVAELARAELELHAGLRLSTTLDAVRDGGGSGGSVTAGVDGAQSRTDLVGIATGGRPAARPPAPA